MNPQSSAEVFAELEQRLLASRRNVADALRRLDEVFYAAEREKREIASYYRQRRLQRLSRNNVT